MRAIAIAVAVAVLLGAAGCSSSQPSINDPDVAVQIASGFPALRPGIDVPMTLDVFVRNNSGDAIKIEQARLESWGTVSYSVRSRMEYFQETIQPGETGRVRIPAYARAISRQAAGSERLSVRLTIMIATPYGRKQRVYFRDAGGSMEGPR